MHEGPPASLSGNSFSAPDGARADAVTASVAMQLVPTCRPGGNTCDWANRVNKPHTAMMVWLMSTNTNCWELSDIISVAGRVLLHKNSHASTTQPTQPLLRISFPRLCLPKLLSLLLLFLSRFHRQHLFSGKHVVDAEFFALRLLLVSLAYFSAANTSN